LPLALGAGSWSEIRMMSSFPSIFASNTWRPPARLRIRTGRCRLPSEGVGVRFSDAGRAHHLFRL
jgi:hypothetical protein